VTACNGAGGIAGSFIVRQPEAPRYLTAIWVSIGFVYAIMSLSFEKLIVLSRSHILMIVFVFLFSAYFFLANRRQERGKKIIEGTV
jgi:hypothetical protein